MVKFGENQYMIIGGIDSNGEITDKTHTFNADLKAASSWTESGKLVKHSVKNSVKNS